MLDHTQKTINNDYLVLHAVLSSQADKFLVDSNTLALVNQRNDNTTPLIGHVT